MNMNKNLLTAFALFLIAGFSSAKADCISIGLINGSGSPPVVYGSTVDVAVLWEVPSADVLLDGIPVASFSDPFSPPGTQWLDTFQVPVSNGSHTLQSTFGPCFVNFAVSPLTQITDTAAMTAGLSGSWGSAGISNKGFRSGLGSITPATTSNGRIYSELLDSITCLTIFGGTVCTGKDSWIAISGFLADPGQGWLVSTSALGVTRLGSAASYTYDSGTGLARWTWKGKWFGFVPSTTTTATIVHY